MSSKILPTSFTFEQAVMIQLGVNPKQFAVQTPKDIGINMAALGGSQQMPLANNSLPTVAQPVMELSIAPISASLPTVSSVSTSLPAVSTSLPTTSIGPFLPSVGNSTMGPFLPSVGNSFVGSEDGYPSDDDDDDDE